MSDRLMLALNQIKTLPQITIGHIADHAQSEALLILCLMSILPFLQPIPIPGLSTVLGMIVILQGIGLLIQGRPLLTQKLRNIVITHEKFEIIHRSALKFSHLTSKFSSFKSPLVSTRISHMLCGISIILSASFLSLPLPIPFSNLVPALSIFLICLGLLEEDIILLLIGHSIGLVVFWMAMFSYQFLMERFHAWI
jgi:hypothetical protein